jgi:2-phosphosulfolactate phosphatase
MPALEVLFTPADFAALANRDLSQTCCVVFDVLRATSSIVTALWNGAEAILPVEEIKDALAARSRSPRALLAGERDGVRIGAELTGGPTFDLGNSPREFSAPAVRGKTLVMTTTNGTRALKACAHANRALASSFLNLDATAQELLTKPADLLIVCSGTYQETAYEDVLGAGALCEKVWPVYGNGRVTDSAQIARQLFLNSRENLSAAMAHSKNARRLLSRPDLEADVAFCLRLDATPLVAELHKDGFVRRKIE